jgi:hypothetical protein
VLVEPPVLDGQEGLDHPGRDFARAQHLAPFLGPVGQQRAIPAAQDGRFGRLVLVSIYVGQLREPGVEIGVDADARQ